MANKKLEQHLYKSELSLEFLVLRELQKIKPNGNFLPFNKIYGRLGRILHLKKKDTRLLLQQLQKKNILKINRKKGVVVYFKVREDDK